MTSSPQKIISIFFFISSLIIPHTSIANNDLANAKKEAEAIGSINLNKAQGLATQDPTSNKVNQVSVAEVMNFQGTEVPEKTFADGNMYDASQKKSTDANSNESIVVKDAFMKQKEFRIDGKDTFLDKADHVQKNPETYVDWLKGKYSDCEQKGGDDLIAKEKFTCDEYQQITDKKCKIGRIVEVDAKHSYQCKRKRVSENKVCSKSLNVTCQIQYKAAPELIIPDKSSTISWMYNYPSLILDTSDRAVHSSRDNEDYVDHSDLRTRRFIFHIKDKQFINVFRMVSFGFYLHITFYINGKYLHQREGGSRTYMNYDPNISLLPYLKEGYNYIEIKSYAPYVRFEIDIAKNICIQKETWNEVCQ